MTKNIKSKINELYLELDKINKTRQNISEQLSFFQLEQFKQKNQHRIGKCYQYKRVEDNPNHRNDVYVKITGFRDNGVYLSTKIEYEEYTTRGITHKTTTIQENCDFYSREFTEGYSRYKEINPTLFKQAQNKAIIQLKDSCCLHKNNGRLKK